MQKPIINPYETLVSRWRKFVKNANRAAGCVKAEFKKYFLSAEHRFEKTKKHKTLELSKTFVESTGAVKQPDFINGKINFDWIFKIEKGEFVWTKVYLS